MGKNLDLKSKEILLLPPNTTARLQPMCVGIIAAVKLCYRAIQFEILLDLVDEGVENILNIDHLTDIWNSLLADIVTDIIANCWRDTGRVDPGVHGPGVLPLHGSVASKDNDFNEDKSVVANLIKSLAYSISRMYINSILCAEDTVAHTEEFSEEIL